MNKLINLVKGWSERLSINMLGFLYPGVSKETLDKIKEAYNTKNKNIEETIADLKSADPANLSSYISLEGIFKQLKPIITIVIFAGIVYFGFKLYKEYKK